MLYCGRANGSSAELPVSHLHYKEHGASTPLGGGATSIDGLISTRQGNGSAWAAMIGKSPIGEWQLALPDTDAVRARFKGDGTDRVEDMVLVITYSGRTPEWPA
jgi:hypothetical protein